MKVKEIMTKDVFWIRPDTNLQEAASKMKELDTGVLPVCDGENICGMITDRDIAIRSTAQGQDPKNSKISDIMTPQVEFCHEEEDLEKIAQRMEAKRIRRLPVIGPEKKIVGIISLGDVVRRGESKVACEILEEVSEPTK